MERKYYFRGLGLGIVVTAIIMGTATSHSRRMTDQEIIARAKELGMVENTVLADMDGKEAEKVEMTKAGEENLAEENNNGSADGEQAAGEEPGEAKQAQNDDEIEKTNQAQNVSGKVEDEDESSGDSEVTAAEGQGLGEIDGSGTVQGDSNELAEDDKEEAADGKDKPTDRDREPDKQSFGNENEKNSEGGSITVRTGDGSHTVAKKLADAGIVSSADDFDSFLCQHGYDKKLRTGTFYIPSDADDEQIAKIITGVE